MDLYDKKLYTPWNITPENRPKCPKFMEISSEPTIEFQCFFLAVSFKDLLNGDHQGFHHLEWFILKEAYLESIIQDPWSLKAT